MTKTWIATTYYNPAGYESRKRNYEIFWSTLKIQGAKLITHEIVFPDISSSDNNLPDDSADILIRTETKSKLWHKERAFNLLLDHLPEECENICFVDCDLIFENKNWVEDLTVALEKYDIIQPFDLFFNIRKGWLDAPGPGWHVTKWAKYAYWEPGLDLKLDRLNVPYDFFGGHSALYVREFAREFYDKDDPRLHWYLGHMGGAIAMKRDIIEKHRFFDKCIVGGGDVVNFCGITGAPEPGRANGNDKKRPSHWPIIDEEYQRWKSKISSDSYKTTYMKNACFHLYHGDRANRQYIDRYNILIKNDFSISDLKIEKGSSLYCVEDEALSKQIEQYFLDRREDE